MKKLVPYERQMFLASIYHYAWYNDEAYAELQEFLQRWSAISQPPTFIINENDTTTNGA